MPDRLITNPEARGLIAVIMAMVAGLIARTLVSKEPFERKKFIGELILAAMFGAAIFAFGVIQGLGFWQTLLMSLLSGMGTTRSIEWLTKIAKAAKDS